MTDRVVWSTSLRQTLRLLPALTPPVAALLECGGLTEEEALLRLPYEQARSRAPSSRPNPRRLRDIRAVCQAIGLVTVLDGRLRVTDLGEAVRRWAPDLSTKNAAVLGRHAALALSVCQLRNPLGGSSGYAESVIVHPFAFIWRAMLDLDYRISSEELNCELLRADGEYGLIEAVGRIAANRRDPDQFPMREPVATGDGVNDRLIPWMSLASFGWVLIQDKRDSVRAQYEIRPELRDILSEVAHIRRPHRDFATADEYVQFVSDAAALPRDLRRETS